MPRMISFMNLNTSSYLNFINRKSPTHPNRSQTQPTYNNGVLSSPVRSKSVTSSTSRDNHSSPGSKLKNSRGVMHVWIFCQWFTALLEGIVKNMEYNLCTSYQINESKSIFLVEFSHAVFCWNYLLCQLHKTMPALSDTQRGNLFSSFSIFTSYYRSRYIVVCSIVS